MFVRRSPNSSDAFLPIRSLQVVLSSDEQEFGGYCNVTKNNDISFPTGSSNHDNRPYDMMVYAPSRTVVSAVYLEGGSFLGHLCTHQLTHAH
jgi:hypothetical protein